MEAVINYCKSRKDRLVVFHISVDLAARLHAAWLAYRLLNPKATKGDVIREYISLLPPAAGFTLVSCLTCKKNFTISLSDKERIKYCSKKCASIRIMRCSLCGKKIHRRESYKAKRAFCSNLCREVSQGLDLRERMMVYTPEFLRSLREDGLDHCPFPGCESLRAPLGPSNPFELCWVHGRRVYANLRSRKRVRERSLQAEGL